MKRRPYPRYKPSGVEWLGDVPEHWTVMRSDGIIATEKRQVSPAFFASEVVFHYSIPHVQETGDGVEEDGESIASAKQLIDGPVILVSRLNPRKATICRATPRDRLTLASTEFVALKPQLCDLSFLQYLVSTELFRQRLDSWVQSVTRSHQRASPEHIYRFWGAWPPVSEQRTIVSFLDRETERIDKLVAKKRELIERLKEKRAALISRTVTRGLPPEAAAKAGLPVNPPLKDSGVEWLGKIPAHWEVSRMRRALRNIQQGWSPDCEGVPAEYNEWGVVRAGCCNNGVFNPEDNKALPTDLDPLPELEIRAGDLLMSRASGSADLLGSASIVPDSVRPRLLLSDKVYRLHCRKEKAIPAFLGRFLESRIGRLQISAAISGALGLAKNIAQSDIRDFVIPLPPVDEQQALASYLHDATSKLDALAVKVEEAIVRLREYRTALITASVTGKIKT